MKLDKKTVDMLSSLPDDKLWQIFCVVGSSAGIRIPDKIPDERRMAGLRAALCELSDTDLVRAAQIIEIYKGGKENGKR